MQYKQIILIRQDVDMRCGKKCVQVSHASMMGADLCDNSILVENWKKEGMRKIVLKVRDLIHLNSLTKLTDESGIPHAVVIDLGLTQIEPNTITCVGYIPVNEDSEKGKALNQITKELTLL